MVVQVVLLACIVLSFYTVERVGRRPSLLAGAGVMGSCTLIIGILGAVQNQNGSALVALCAIWVAAYAVSAGPLGEFCLLLLGYRLISGWTFVAEASTPRLRAKTAGTAAAGTAAVGLIFNYTVPIMLDVNGANWGNKIGFLWAGLTSLGTIVVFFMIPEVSLVSYSTREWDGTKLDRPKVEPTPSSMSYLCEACPLVCSAKLRPRKTRFRRCRCDTRSAREEKASLPTSDPCGMWMRG